MIEFVRNRVREEGAMTMFTLGAALSVTGLAVAGSTSGGVDTAVGAGVQLVGVGVLVATAVWSDVWDPRGENRR